MQAARTAPSRASQLVLNATRVPLTRCHCGTPGVVVKTLAESERNVCCNTALKEAARPVVVDHLQTFAMDSASQRTHYCGDAELGAGVGVDVTALLPLLLPPMLSSNAMRSCSPSASV